MCYFQEKKKDYKDSGEIRVEYIQIQPIYTFLDYVQGGTEMFCTVAIDYTGKTSCLFPIFFYFFICMTHR